MIATNRVWLAGFSALLALTLALGIFVWASSSAGAQTPPVPTPPGQQQPGQPGQPAPGDTAPQQPRQGKECMRGKDGAGAGGQQRTPGQRQPGDRVPQQSPATPPGSQNSGPLG